MRSNAAEETSICNEPYTIVSQASVGRVFDAVRVLASGIQMALDNGLPLNNNHLPARDFCNATVDKRSDDRGKRLSNFLRKVRKLYHEDKSYNPRQKSLARLDQITGTCIDKLFWKQ